MIKEYNVIEYKVLCDLLDNINPTHAIDIDMLRGVNDEAVNDIIKLEGSFVKNIKLFDLDFNEITTNKLMLFKGIDTVKLIEDSSYYGIKISFIAIDDTEVYIKNISEDAPEITEIKTGQIYEVLTLYSIWLKNDNSEEILREFIECQKIENDFYKFAKSCSKDIKTIAFGLGLINSYHDEL